MAAPSEQIQVQICTGTGGIASGSLEVAEAFEAEFAKHGVEAKVGKRCDVKRTGCRGLCANDVLVDIVIPGQAAVSYDFVTVDMVPQLVEEHILAGNPVVKKVAGKYYTDFLAKQQRIVFSRCGTIDAESFDDFIEHQGFNGIRKAVTMKPEEVIEEVKKSGLRGRGGGGFPTGMKWSFCKATPGNLKYLICNADEGDPGAFMDRSVLEGDPYGLIEGMMIGAYAIGCTYGYVYVRAEYPLAIKRLQKAIDTCYEKGILGKDCMGLGFKFDLKIKAGAGAFVCGEETALMASIEGQRGMSRPRPPFPAVRGLWGKPTNINNVETFANISYIFYNSAEWYASIGTEGTKGTKIFALTGKVKHTGLVEVPAGTTVREVIYDVCGGIDKNRKFKAVQAGGPSGGCLPADALEAQVDYDSLIKAGAGAFVCGEETALMASIEGQRGMSRPRPPFPAVRGLWGKPTNINNVETFANISYIFYNSAEWYASIGTEGTKGTKIFALTGKVKHTGLVEVPAGTTVREVIYDVCGGIDKNRKFKAVQAGGPSGGCLPAEALEAQVDYDSLIKAGAMMGSGGLVVMDETTCMVDVARFFLNFTRVESCGKCIPCRIGLKIMLEILERICSGEGREGDIELLLDMSVDIKKSSLCGLGQTAPNPVMSTIRYFRDEYEAHIKDKYCPSHVCKPLLKFSVMDNCKKCGLCKKACPVDAIIWEKGQLAVIELDKCTRCTSCYDACPFMAIE